MDRVNRSMVFPPALIAVTAALLIVSLVQADSPVVQQAVGRGSDESQVIQQVVGKQPQLRQTRPGLLEVLAGSKPKGSVDHRHKNMSKGESKGLLDALFNGVNSKSAKTSAPNKKSSQPTSRSSRSSRSQSGQSQASKKVNTQASSNAKPGNVNWDGIPYHNANTSRPSDQSEPIRDPLVGNASRSEGTRIIRGGSGRTIQAQPASVRRNSESLATGQPEGEFEVPIPPRDIDPVPVATRKPSTGSTLSTSSSSRRSGRRNVQGLDGSQTAVASKSPSSASEPKEDEVDDLIPRVSRKQVSTQPKPSLKEEAADSDAEEKQPQPAIPAPKFVRKPVPNKPVPSKDVAAKKTNLPQPPQEDPESRTAIAAIGVPAPSPSLHTEPISSTEVHTPSATTLPSPIVASTQPPVVTEPTVAAQPMISGPTQIVNPKLNVNPTANGSEPKFASESAIPTPPAYTTPTDSPLPTQPYAASNPEKSVAAAAASHRAGPPSNAFQDGTQDPSHFNTTSSPVGSGFVPNSDVASYRYQTEPTQNAPTYDPYSRTGQNNQVNALAQSPPPPVVGSPSSLSPLTSPGPNGVYPDVNAQMPSPNRIADNFSPSTLESRNQMRDRNRRPNTTASSSELPGIRVATYGPSEVMIRQTNQYEIRVENRGSIDASGVIVRTVVPDWAEVRGQTATRGNVETQTQVNVERMIWTIDHLPAGASERMFVRLTAARSGTFDLDVDWTTLPQKSIARVTVHEPRLNLTIEGPDQVVYGQSQTYKVRVLNPGDGTAPNVVFTLSPNSATPQTQRIGDIPPGKEAQFDVELTAQDLGDLKIHGLASGDLELRAESSKTIRVAAANLEAVLTGPEVKYQNTEAMYSLQLQNSGIAASEQIVATLRLPSGVKYLGGIEDAALQGNALKWKVSSLPPGASRDYQFRCSMTSTGEQLFAFDCKGTAAGNTDVSIATRVDSIADLVLTVSDPVAPAPIGSDVIYEIVVRNRGSKEATDVRAIAQFSHGIEPLRIEGQTGEVVTGQVLFDPIPRIGPGQEVQLRVIAQADRAGHHRFRTEVRSGDTVLVAEEATHYTSPQSDRVSRRSANAGNR